MSIPQTSVGSQGVLYAGVAADTGAGKVDSYVNAEASAEIVPGTMVRESGDHEALKLAGASATKLCAIALLSHAMAKPTELGDTGIKPDATFGGGRKGVFTVVTEVAVNPGDTVRVRHTSGAGGTVLGAFRVAAVAGETFDISKFAQWRSVTAAAGVAELEIDMTMAVLVAADV